MRLPGASLKQLRFACEDIALSSSTDNIASFNQQRCQLGDDWEICLQMTFAFLGSFA
jgi:hypothetical protein